MMHSYAILHHEQKAAHLKMMALYIQACNCGCLRSSMQAFCNVTRLPTSQTKSIPIIRIMDIMVTLHMWSIMMRAEDGKLQSHLEWP